MDPQLVSFTRELSGRAGHDHLSPSRITLRAALGRWHQFVVRWPVLPVGAEPFRGGGRQCQIWRRTWRENLFSPFRSLRIIRITDHVRDGRRSEERRVGKEGSERWGGQRETERQ